MVLSPDVRGNQISTATRGVETYVLSLLFNNMLLIIDLIVP